MSAFSDFAQTNWSEKFPYIKNNSVSIQKAGIGN